MNFSLIICTYQRAKPLLRLLESVKLQSLYPTEILIIDGSLNHETQHVLIDNYFTNLKYFLVSDNHRGLTKQRNFGISKLSTSSQIVCFLDDDTVLEPNYFEQILSTFTLFPDAAGVGGIAINENNWHLNINNTKSSAKYFVLDGFYVKESSRNYLRNFLGLNSDKMPGVMPEFSHGRTFAYPLNKKVYPVDMIVGMSMSFRTIVVQNIKFSEYFEGYGLYEDADFSIRALKYGQNYINTAALLNHFHDAAGRPNQFQYGKMVIRNGYYVWRVKYPNPAVLAKIKWLQISVLLILIRLTNVVTTKQKIAALTETAGRVVGLFSLIFNKPKTSYR